MRLKQYLRPDGLRPIWAYLADLILAECAAKKYKGVGVQALRNQFIQNWNSNLKNSAMPDSLRRMIKAARKHQVQFTPETLNKELQLNVDIWFHPEIEGRAPVYKDRWSRCQKETHAIQTVNDMRNHAQKNEYHEHTPNDENCGCPHCFQDRADGCEIPDECRRNTLQKLSKLKLEWRPETMIRERRTEAPKPEKMAADEKEDRYRVVNEPVRRHKGNPNYHVRVFANKHGTTPNETGLWGLENRISTTAWNAPSVSMYTDGSCTGNGTGEAKAGSGIWYARGDERNKALRVPDHLASNNAGELLAI
ncbi:hypothetical protein BKA70DRAFT_1044897, partial [Coprinopsis sp. MPI-PUGE-AT-0042]